MADIKRLTETEINDLIDNAVDQFNDGKDAECVAAVRAVLQHRVSRWQEIYCLALLADCLEDWYKAEEQRYMAETMYDNARFLWPLGKDAAVDERLKDLREQLDETREN
ncbi:unnamed protein product [Aureobasidium mustum]|uniref:Uncharacterized protein n=1 Tax=Aureobasidium mustum TaxID=2773714 RepID=A0A9N8PIF6_9PEZI|nr:unnamed protein product [Aureobasidium mustum]